MFIEINQLRIHYKVIGQGQPVVIMHGWGCSLKTLESVQVELAKQFQVYSLDLPGFGSSSDPEMPWGVKDYARMMEKFFQQLQIQQPILLGHSLGGRIGIQLASDNSQSFKKLILVNSSGVKPKRKLKFYFRVYFFKIFKKIVMLPGIRSIFRSRIESYKKKFGSTDYKNSSGVMRNTLVKVVNEDLKDRMPKIKIPTLLIWGEHDKETPLSAGKIMQSLIPDSNLVILKNTGHYTFLDQFKEFMVVVNKFLTKES